MKLFEILDTQSLMQRTVGNHYWHAKGIVGGRQIVVDVDHFNRRQDVWMFSFAEREPKNSGAGFSLNYHKTGSGKPFEVAAFVMSALKLFIKDVEPTNILFSSSKEDGNRTKLYTRMLEKNKIPGYTFKMLDVEEKKQLGLPDAGSEDFLMLVKDKK